MRCLRILCWVLLVGTGLSSCTISRMARYNFSDIKDYEIFASRPLEPAAEPYFFPQLPNEAAQSKMDFSVEKKDEQSPFLEALPASNTVAFLVIHKDTIRYERYFDGYDEESWVASFSMAKSWTSALIGIAIEEGHIGGVDEEVVKYIPELRKRGWEGVTIEHVLQMTTGVRHQESYFNPFAGVARSYYGRHLSREVGRLKQERPEGEEFAYKSINTQILGEILVRATGQNLTDYLQEKLWTPLGMEHPASWSLDQKKDGMEKAFCCINATAHDFAKFGQLYLQNGVWQGEQVVPRSWVEASTRVDTTNGAVSYYQYQWWMPGGDGSYSAQGHLGQFIYVQPKKDLVIVRLGKNAGGLYWFRVFRDIAAQF